MIKWHSFLILVSTWICISYPQWHQIYLVVPLSRRVDPESRHSTYHTSGRYYPEGVHPGPVGWCLPCPVKTSTQVQVLHIVNSSEGPISAMNQPLFLGLDNGSHHGECGRRQSLVGIFICQHLSLLEPWLQWLSFCCLDALGPFSAAHVVWVALKKNSWVVLATKWRNTPQK